MIKHASVVAGCLRVLSATSNSDSNRGSECLSAIAACLQVLSATSNLAEECTAESLNLEKAAVGPDKTRRAADLLVNAVKGLQLQMEQATNKLQQQEARL